MTYELTVDQTSGVGAWVCAKAGGTWISGRGSSLGLLLHGRLVAGILYEDFNGANIQMHVAAEDGKHWLTRKFLYALFYYPFEQLQCKRVTALVASSNTACRRLLLHVGFVVEAVLTDAHPEGDLIVFMMKKADCKWLNPKYAKEL